MSGAFPLDHWFDEAPLLLEPVVTAFPQVRDRMFPEELCRDVLFRRLAGECLHSVLAKLEQVTVTIGTRPRTALTIESILFVHLQPGLKSANRAYLAKGKLQTLRHGRHARCNMLRFAELSAVLKRRLS